jgi:hypothetical protein
VAPSGTTAGAARELPANFTFASPPAITCYVSPPALTPNVWANIADMISTGGNPYSCGLVASANGTLSAILITPASLSGYMYAIVVVY